MKDKTGPVIISLKERTAIIDAAIAQGTHSKTSQHLCHGCREFVDAIYYTTIDKKRLCGECADKFGQGPKADAEKLKGKRRVA